MNLVKRVAATQKTVDRFKGRAFGLENRGDCIRLTIGHARHMGKRIKVPQYRDWKSAGAALKKLGFKTLAEAMDHHFRRIDPVEILAGDILEAPGENGFSSLMVALGNGRALGFHQDIPHCDILQPLMISGAWRID